MLLSQFQAKATQSTEQHKNPENDVTNETVIVIETDGGVPISNVIEDLPISNPVSASDILEKATKMVWRWMKKTLR